MKRLKHIFSWTIWSLLALYLLLVLLIQLPPVQSWLGSAVAGALSSELGTKVSVGRVDLGFFNRLIIDDVVISDRQDVEMLRARRLAVRLEVLPLVTDRRISISSAQLFGTEATLYRDSAGAEPNYQFAIDALSGDDSDKESAIDLHIGSIIVRKLSARYDVRDEPETPGRFNTSHLMVSDVSAHVLLRCLTNDSLNVVVKRISMKEQSGLEVKNLTMKMEGNSSQAVLTGFRLQTPRSDIRIDSTFIDYSLDDLASTLEYRTGIQSSVIALKDFAPLLPEWVPANHTFSVNTSLEGTAHSIEIPSQTISSRDNSLSLDLTADYSPDGSWSASLRRLAVSSSLIDELCKALPSVPEAATRLGNVSVSGQASCSPLGEMTAHGSLDTDLGTLLLRGTYDTDASLWTAHLDTDSLDLGRMTANANAGLLAANLDLHGHDEMVGVSGVVPRIDLNGYSYHDIVFDGTYSQEDIAGKLKVDDSNLKADIEGSFSPQNIRLTGFIEKIAPQSLHLSDRWGAATFSAVVDADISGTSLSDATGTLDLDDFIMERGDSTIYHLDNLHVRSSNSDDTQRSIRIRSDFGEMSLLGRFDITTLPRSIAGTAAAKYTFNSLNSTPAPTQYNDFALTVNLSDSHWLQELLGIDLELDGPLDIVAEVDDSQRKIALRASVPSFSYANRTFRNGRLSLDSENDSASCTVTVNSITGKDKAIAIDLNAHTENDELHASLSFSSEGTDGGDINAVTRLYADADGKRATHIHLLPSRLVNKDMTWTLEPCDIVVSNKHIGVDHFALHHNDEHLIIDGTASKLPGDTLLVDLRGVDVASVLDIVGFHAVSFGGKATGKAFAAHALSDAEAWADIRVDSLLFQEALMGTLNAHATWNMEKGQIDLIADIYGNAGATTFVDGYISPRHNELSLDFKAHGTNIAFIHSFTNSFIGSIEGGAYGDIRLAGPLKALNLEGRAAITGKASITPLGTTYSFEGDTVRLVPNDILFTDFHAYDRDHHQATMNGGIHHNNLKSITFDLVVDAEHLLAYDQPLEDVTGTIGGTIWADGQAVLRGRSGEVVIDCDVTPAPGSVFIYNAANPDAINRQQFITWGERDEVRVQSSELRDFTSEPRLKMKDDRYDYTSRGDFAEKSKVSQLSTLNSQLKGDLRMNLRINATPDATLRLLMDQHSGDAITLAGTGVLRASYYNKGPFQMFGTYSVERGTYSMTIQNILKKNFLFQPGSSLVFGGDPLQAALDLKARHTVNGVSLSDLGLGNSFTRNTIRVNCLMNILGTAGEPRVEFDLELPTVNSEEEQMIRSIIASEQELNQQVVYLLGIGRFYTQGANNAATQQYGQTELAMQSLLSGTVSSQINQLLSQVIKNDDWNFGANISTGNEGWHNAEYEGLVSGRMLNNRLLINGQFGYRDNATQASPSFIGDFDINYLLTPSGSLALKAYNQTNDRYFTHSSLNTQGIGILMKKDFNGLRDLFTHRRKNEAAR